VKIVEIWTCQAVCNEKIGSTVYGHGVAGYVFNQNWRGTREVVGVEIIIRAGYGLDTGRVFQLLGT